MSHPDISPLLPPLHVLPKYLFDLRVQAAFAESGLVAVDTIEYSNTVGRVRTAVQDPSKWDMVSVRDMARLSRVAASAYSKQSHPVRGDFIALAVKAIKTALLHLTGDSDDAPAVVLKAMAPLGIGGRTTTEILFHLNTLAQYLCEEGEFACAPLGAHVSNALAEMLDCCSAGDLEPLSAESFAFAAGALVNVATTRFIDSQGYITKEAVAGPFRFVFACGECLLTTSYAPYFEAELKVGSIARIRLPRNELRSMLAQCLGSDHMRRAEQPNINVGYSATTGGFLRVNGQRLTLTKAHFLAMQEVLRMHHADPGQKTWIAKRAFMFGDI